MSTTTASRPGNVIATPHRAAPVVALCVLGAGLSVASGAIHLHLWNIAYRHIPNGHLDKLFLVQLILCFVGAAAVLVMRNVLAAVADALLLLGTYGGYLITRYHGWFGFDPGKAIDTKWATWSMVVEIAGAVVLFLAAGLMVRGRPASSTA